VMLEYGSDWLNEYKVRVGCGMTKEWAIGCGASFDSIERTDEDDFDVVDEHLFQKLIDIRYFEMIKHQGEH
jgi:hypothetical protein